MKKDLTIQSQMGNGVTGFRSTHIEGTAMKTPSETGPSDLQIEQAILQELIKQDAFIGGNTIRIKVKNGIVLLNGRSNWGFKKMADLLSEIKTLAGVKSIINNVKVIPDLNSKEMIQ